MMVFRSANVRSGRRRNTSGVVHRLGMCAPNTGLDIASPATPASCTHVHVRDARELHLSTSDHLPSKLCLLYENFPLGHEESGRASKRALMVAVEFSSLRISTEATNKLKDPKELLPRPPQLQPFCFPLNQGRKGWFGPDTR